jgi:hypothetical protein
VKHPTAWISSFSLSRWDLDPGNQGIRLWHCQNEQGLGSSHQTNLVIRFFYLRWLVADTATVVAFRTRHWCFLFREAVVVAGVFGVLTLQPSFPLEFLVIVAEDCLWTSVHWFALAVIIIGGRDGSICNRS